MADYRRENRIYNRIDKCIYFCFSHNYFDTFQGLPDCFCMLHREDNTMVIFLVLR